MGKRTLPLRSGTVTPIESAIEVTHISEKEEARLENERLKNLIAKPSKSLSAWGRPGGQTLEQLHAVN
tara:strand:+ start:173 stop:376 length:204 start_codon:yes stop_codon:yes gene_type:complete